MSNVHRIFGNELSPYSVKVRSYFRYKKIPHEWIVRDATNEAEFRQYAKLPLIPLVVTPDGTWRLYLSCASYGTRHWRVEVIEASAPDAFDPVRRRVLLPGDAATAVKDPVIRHVDNGWHLWASVHPLDDPEQTDRMATDYASSADGLDWTWRGTALHPRPGEWDARGARLTAVRSAPEGLIAYYDGRASAAQNCEELTGIAAGTEPGSLTAIGSEPVAQSPWPGHGLRYLDIVDLGDGHERLYYELTNASGSHDLVTELRPRGR